MSDGHRYTPNETRYLIPILLRVQQRGGDSRLTYWFLVLLALVVRKHYYRYQAADRGIQCGGYSTAQHHL